MDTPESLYKEQLERCTELMLKQNDIINKQRCELAYGSGKNNYSYGSSVSDTGSQAGSGRSSVGVQGFADGGLVSAPTLAMIGEGGGREAALPLDNPEAMRHIGKAVSDAMAEFGGGGHQTHIHLPHGMVIGDAQLSKFAQKMSGAVTKGRATLQASHSFRNNKRGG
jgi:hypothetical protein